MNIAVFCSGQGTNLQAIINAVRRGRIRAKLALVICDNPKAYAIERARRAGIEVALVESREFPTTEAFEGEITRHLKERKIGLIALAGFMKVLSPRFVKGYKNRILNIHPALLPSFRGAHAIKDALKYGVKFTGATVHFVTEKVDSGPVVLQAVCPVKDGDTEEKLLARVHKLEHEIYTKAIELFVEGRLKMTGKRARILPVLLFAALMAGVLGRPFSFAEEREFVVKDVHIPVSILYEKGRFDDVSREALSNCNYSSCLGDSEYKPLTKEELSEKKLNLYFQGATLTAELLDSLYMPFMADGLFELIGYGYKIKGYKDLLEDKYNLHLEVSKSNAFVTYKKKY